MITINLLPAEYRRLDATPIARFVAIILGVVLVTSELISFGYIHYSKVKGARELRQATEAEFANKKAQADVSDSLKKEISAYENRRQAIASIAGKRLLWSRKLDELLDIFHNDGDRANYFVWLKDGRMLPRVAGQAPRVHRVIGLHLVRCPCHPAPDMIQPWECSRRPRKTLLRLRRRQPAPGHRR